MVLCFIGSADLRISSSSSYRSKHAPYPFLETGKGRRKRPPVLLVRAAKRRSPSKGLQKEPKRALSGILRTEAAVLGVERKAGSAKSSNLWPRAVLEALDDSISNNRWESALKVNISLLFSGFLG